MWTVKNFAIVSQINRNVIFLVVSYISDFFLIYCIALFLKLQTQSCPVTDKWGAQINAVVNSASHGATLALQLCCWPHPSPLSSSPFISIHKDQHKDRTIRLECNFCHLLNIVLLLAYTSRGSWNMEMKLLFLSLCTCTVCRPVQLYDSCVWILKWQADFTDGVCDGGQNASVEAFWVKDCLRRPLILINYKKCKNLIYFSNGNLLKFLCWHLP